MSHFKYLFSKDYERFKHTKWDIGGYRQLIRSKVLRYIYTGRKTALADNKVTKFIWGSMNNIIGLSMGNEIDFKDIEKGLVLTHPYNITVSSGSVLGENVTLFKGVTVGSIRSGPRAGCPQIGNHVVICSNAMVCGGIEIGDDVMIAAGAFVDFDVPDHSLVIGNPGSIHSKVNASIDWE